MKRILVTGAGGSAAANFIDSIKLAFGDDLYIVGVDVSPYHLELSKADVRYLVPKVTDSDYVDTMNRIVEKENIDFIHPQPDVEVNFISKHPEKFNAKTFIPQYSVVEACHDKMEFNRLMAKSGIATPESRFIDSPESLRSALADLTKIHPRVWLRAIRGAGSKASLPISNFYQGDAWIDYWRGFKGLDYGDFMASEFLPGSEYAWQSLWFEGELITSQARERVEYIFGNLTPSGQSSSPSVARTVNRDEVNRAGIAAVKSVSEKPSGVFCVDMKEDVSGSPKVTEINVGRFFTTSNFFSHAGLNMPAMYLEFGLYGKTNFAPAQLNPLPDNLLWTRMIDMGYKLVRNDEWTSQKIS